MTELEAISTAALALLLGAMSPGPSLAVVVRATMQGGRIGGVLCAVGHGLGFAFYATAVVFGLSAVMAQQPEAFVALQWLGVALLLFLAYRTLFSGSSVEHTDSSGGNHFAIGFFTAFLNPKIALFFLAVFATVLQPNMQTSAQIIIAALGWAIDTLWYALVALALSAPIAVNALRSSGVWIDRFMAMVLLALAITTAVRLSSPAG